VSGVDEIYDFLDNEESKKEWFIGLFNRI